MSYVSSHPHYRPLTINANLRLIEPTMEHASASLSWVEQPEVVQLMGADFTGPTLEGEEKRIQEIRQSQDEYSWMIEHENKVIGNVCINCIKETTDRFSVKAGNLTVLIGSKNAWGKGIGTNVCTAVLNWAFHEAGFQAMGARALQENAGSIRTLQKLGFTETGTEPYEGRVGGKESVWHTFELRHRPIANEEIHIVPYNPAWPGKFANEKAMIEAAIGHWLDGGVHHVGSTSIPGMSAKPIIDIQVGVRNLEEAKACIPLLEGIGYCYAPYRPYMHWFCKPSPAHREFHLQLMEPAHPQWQARLSFRDHLRAHPDTAKEYEALKRELAVKYRDDREAYTEAKGAFIESVLQK